MRLTTTNVVLLFLSVSLSFTAHIYAHPSTNFVTSPLSQQKLSLSVLRQHFPSHATHPTNELSKHLYEHDPSTDRLVSEGEILHTHLLSPRRINAPPAARYLVNGERVHHSQGPIVRMGDRHVFVYDYRSGILLGGWGPGLNLKPLDFANHPSVFVNIHHEEHQLKSNSIHTVRQFQFQNNTEDLGHFRPQWNSERRIFFDVGLAFDASFCSAYAKDPSFSTQMIHGVGVGAHQMSLTPIVSVRIGDIVGFCEYDPPPGNSSSTDTPSISKKDVFGPPPTSTIKSCEQTKGCTVPDLRLRFFRNAWRSYINDSLSDAVYLLTMSKPILKDTIVGAAWVASACSDFGFGWVLGNHPVILAHEMGHTLGAPHSSEGLMRPYLGLKTRSSYKGTSLASIDNFIARLSGQACLVGRHQGKTDERRFTGFTRIVNPQSIANGFFAEGSDIATGTVRLHGEVVVVMLQVMKYSKGNVGAEMRTTTLSRSAEKGFPFTYNNTYSTQYVRTSHSLEFKAGAGVAIASLKNELKDDVICVMVKRSSKKIYYIIGYDISFGSKLVVNGGWSFQRVLPLDFKTTEVRGLGSVAGDMRGNGEKDLVISYLEHDANSSTIKAKYVIGFHMNGNSAKASRGWSNPVEITIPNHLKLSTKAEDIGDISVAIWDKPSLNASVPSTTSLLFSIISRIPATKEWKTISCVIDNAEKFRRWNTRPKKPINCFVPFKSIYPSRLTGGIALTRLLSSTSPVPTSVIYQSRYFVSGSASQWIDVGDGLLTKQQAIDPGEPELLALSIGEDIIPSDTCSRCYDAKHVKTCQMKVRSCFARREFGKLDKVYASSIRQQVTTSSRQQIVPNSESIFCAGFHSIFILQNNINNNENAKCGWDSKRTTIIAEGVRYIIVEDVSKTKKSEGTAAISKGKIPEDLRYILGSGGFGANFLPTNVRVTVYSATALRWKLIRLAMNKVKKRADFNSFFSDTKQDARIVKKGAKKYIVILKFKLDYQAEFLQDVAAGRAHDGQ